MTPGAGVISKILEMVSKKTTATPLPSPRVVPVVKRTPSVVAAKPMAFGLPASGRGGSVFENLYDAALMTDLAGRIMDANPRALDFLKYTREEALNLTALQVISGADEGLLRTIQENLAEHRFTVVEAFCVRKDGSMFPAEVVANRLAEGGAPRLCFFIRDIRERKEMELQMKEQINFIETILHTVPSPIFYKNLEGIYLGCNQAYEKCVGLSSDQIVGKSGHDLYPQPLAETFLAMDHVLIQSGREQLYEARVPVARGELRDMLIRKAIYRNALGQTVGIVGVLLDITERKRAEAAEREQFERDFEMARDIQRVLLPSEFPNVPNADIGAMSVPARKVGGDYYDVVIVDGDHRGFAIADVSGKGVGAALLMTMCRTALRQTAVGNLSPRQVISRVNTILRPDLKEDLFISMTYGVFDTRTRTLRFCRAGHEPLLVWRSGAAQPERRLPKGMAIGFAEGKDFEEALAEEEVRLEKGDLTLFYTDGITEAMNAAGEEFGLARLEGIIRETDRLPARQRVHEIDKHVATFIGAIPQGDDRTLLLLRATH
ncbi:MAG: SpoIIE family protein phosphatase [Verrucomicrobiae bacterium]|nr:SpoIIE family protein phosphatase [Verrucomicrobiae bacterium]